MVQRMSTDELAAVADRVVGDPPQTEPFRHEPIVASELVGHIRTGDRGAMLRLIHDAEHELGPWRVSPWRLLEELATLLMRPGRTG